uniref:Uncharacterized protein n=1 Tax=Anguilla anguilla TaxID=7936 RepID=A0A0E9WNA5_ANGAN
MKLCQEASVELFACFVAHCKWLKLTLLNMWSGGTGNRPKGGGFGNRCGALTVEPLNELRWLVCFHYVSSCKNGHCCTHVSRVLLTDVSTRGVFASQAALAVNQKEDAHRCDRRDSYINLGPPATRYLTF